MRRRARIFHIFIFPDQIQNTNTKTKYTKYRAQNTNTKIKNRKIKIQIQKYNDKNTKV